MDVDALLTLRADVEKMLVQKSRDLERQLARLGEGRGMAGGKRLGRPPGRANKRYEGRKNCAEVSGARRGNVGRPGRDAAVALFALLKEGHSVEEFLIGQKGGKTIRRTSKDGQEAKGCG